MCGCKLATNQQNFTEICQVRVKILQKVLGGATLSTRTVQLCAQAAHPYCIAKVDYRSSALWDGRMNINFQAE